MDVGAHDDPDLRRRSRSPSPAASLANTELTVDDSWDLQAPEPLTPCAGVTLNQATEKTFRAIMKQAVMDAVTVAGSSVHYLKTRYPTPVMKQEFADQLWSMLPPDDSLAYHLEAKIPTVSEAEQGTVLPVVLHPCMFSFDEKAKVGGPPQNKATLQVLDEVLNDGFLSAGEPLNIAQKANLVDPELHAPWVKVVTTKHEDGTEFVQEQPPHQITPFSVGFVKGQKRAMLCLVICSLILDSGLDLKQAWQYVEWVCLSGWLALGLPGVASKYDECS